MDNFEAIMYVYERLAKPLKYKIFKLKREIEELKYFNRELSYKLPDFQSENKKTPIIMDILNITEKKQIDEAVEEYEYHSYEPITGINLSNPGEVRINIETQGLFTHPSESYLVFDGKLVKNADDTVYADE